MVAEERRGKDDGKQKKLAPTKKASALAFQRALNKPNLLIGLPESF